MALSISLEGTGVIAYCDALSDTGGGTWSEVGGGTIEAAGDAFLCGSACIAGAYSNKSGYQQYDLGSGNELDFDTAGAQEDELLYIWLQTSTIYLHETLANEGLKIVLMTDTSNYREYIIAAGDDTNGWTGDWKCFVIDPTKPGSVSDTGTYDYGSIRYINVWLDITALAKGNNMLIDMITCCKGLRVTGTSTTPWADIVNYCNDFSTRAWGIVQEREGIYYVYGKVYFGDSTQGSNSSFVETSAPIIKFGSSEYYYSSAWVISHPIDFSGIIIEDNATYTTTFDDGVLVGSDQGRSGSTYIGQSDINVNIDLFGGNAAGSLTRLYGTNFRNLTGGITWGNDGDHLFYGGVVSGCAQFDPVGGPVIRNCLFVATADTDAAILWNENIDIEDCSFISNTTGAAVEMPSAVGSPYSYTALNFSGNTYDVLNSSGSSITVNKAGTPQSNPSTYEGSTVTFVGSVTVTITVKDQNGDVIEGVQTAVYKTSDRTQIMNEDTNASGIATESYSGSTPVEVEVRCRKASTGDTKYIPYSSVQTIDTNGLSLSVTLVEDPNNS